MQFIRALIVLMSYPSFFVGFLFAFSWLIWILLKLFHKRRPQLSTMFIYSASIAITFVRYWLRVRVCLGSEHYCEVPFSAPMFIFETTLWFLVLYILMKLVFEATKSYRKVD